jgi:hypothetical protein
MILPPFESSFAEYPPQVRVSTQQTPAASPVPATLDVANRLAVRSGISGFVHRHSARTIADKVYRNLSRVGSQWEEGINDAPRRVMSRPSGASMN